MRRGVLSLVIVCVLGGSAAPAQAHNSRWFWSEALAEQRLERRYAIELADCLGTGRAIRGQRNRRLYRHFDCIVYTEDGDERTLVLHVLGRHRFAVTY